MAVLGTVTSSEMNPLKANLGVNYVRSHTVVTGATVSDVVFLARLPDRATLIWWSLKGGSAGNTSGTWKLGFTTPATLVDTTSGNTITYDSLHAGVSLTVGGMGAPVSVQGNQNLPFRLSLSDDSVNHFAWLALTATSGTLSTSTSLDFQMLYIVGDG